jgi:hypothetical protein
VGHLLAEGIEAEPARTPADVRYRAAGGPTCCSASSTNPAAALALLREVRTGEAPTSRLDPGLAFLVISGAEGEWVSLRAF